MPISLQAARERVSDPVDIYKELRASDRDDYLDLPNGAIIVRYRIVTGTNVDADVHAVLHTAVLRLSNLQPQTPAEAEALADTVTEETALAQAEALVRNVVSWDFSLEDNGPPIPLEVAAIRADVPNAIVNDVLNGIAAHRRMGKNGRRR